MVVLGLSSAPCCISFCQALSGLEFIRSENTLSADASFLLSNGSKFDTDGCNSINMSTSMRIEHIGITSIKTFSYSSFYFIRSYQHTHYNCIVVVLPHWSSQCSRSDQLSSIIQNRWGGERLCSVCCCDGIELLKLDVWLSYVQYFFPIP